MIAIGALLAKALPYLVKFGKMLFKGAKLAGKLGADAAVVTVKVGKRTVQVAKALYNLSKPLGDFMKKHPQLAMILTNIKWDEVRDIAKEIVDALHKVGISTEDAEKVAAEFEEVMQQLQTSQDLNELTSLNLEKEIKALSSLKSNLPLPAGTGNHGKWYFRGSKVSGFTSRDYGLDVNKVLENVIVRNLYLNIGNHAPLRALDNSAIDVDSSMISPMLADAFYQAYVDYYARMNLMPPSTKKRVTANLTNMLLLSVYAVASAFELKRYYNAEETYIETAKVGSELIGLDPMSSFKTSSLLNRISGEFWTRITTDGGAQLRTNYLGRSVVKATASQLVTNRRNTFPVMSNDAWTRMISSLSTVIMSSDTYDWIKYHFDCIREDVTTENVHELYVIHAPMLDTYQLTPEIIRDSDREVESLSIVDDADWADHSANDWRSQIIFCIDTIQAILKSDKAYASMMATLGLMNMSSPSSEEMNGRNEGTNNIFMKMKDDLKRDPMHKTINIIKADNDFFRALTNASFYTVFTGNGAANRRAKLWATVPNFSTVLYGTKPEVRIGWNSAKIIATPSAKDAGDVASAVKWRYLVNFRIGPTGFYSPSDGCWVYVSPYNNTLQIRDKTDEEISILATISYSAANYVIGNAGYEGAIEPVLTVGLLPAEIRYNYAYQKGGALYLDTNNANGYDEYNVIELGEVLGHMYENMLLGIQGVKDMVTALSKMSVYYALMS